MNYYPFYADPVASAMALDDKRVRRLFTLGVNTLRDLGAPRTHWLAIEHDTSVWFKHWVIALGDEIEHRYVKRYKAHDLLDTLELTYHPMLTPPRLYNNAKSCAAAKRPADFTHLPVHEAYQQYANYRWTRIDVYKPRWTARPTPTFYAPLDTGMIT